MAARSTSTGSTTADKLTARERIDILIDPGTFSELGSCVNTTGTRIDGRFTDAPCDGLVVGTAEVHGRPVMVAASDFTVLGGSTGTQHPDEDSPVHRTGSQVGHPGDYLLDSSGGRLGYTEVTMAGIDWQFRMSIRFSGVIPQITVLMGPCIAGGAYLPTLCDFLFMSRVSGNMWLGGPRQTQAATSEVIDRNVGGADYHMQLPGAVMWWATAMRRPSSECREMLRYLPSNYREKPPAVGTDRLAGPGGRDPGGYRPG